jgi:hypothetical protein
MHWSKWNYCAKSGLSSSEWDTVKHQQGGIVFLFVKWSIKDAIFPLQASGIKTIAATETDLQSMMFH